MRQYFEGLDCWSLRDGERLRQYLDSDASTLKRPHFIPHYSSTSTLQVAQSLHTFILRYYALPDSIESARYPLFTLKLWTELMKILNLTLKMPRANHPQTDGQPEVMNKILEEHLRV